MNQEIHYKICNKCGIYLSIDNFYLSKSSKDGRRGDCKKCNNLITKKYYSNNKTHIKQLKSTKILAECWHKSSILCKKYYTINKSEFNNNIKRNGNYRCVICAADQTHTNNGKKFKHNYLFFNKIDSEIKAYLLGIIAGDGHIANKYSYLEIVANSKDTETLELFKTYISPNNVIRKHSTSNNCNKILISSVTLCKDICNHLKISPGKKSNKICLPDFNEDLIKHFIRGLIDSDGWIKDISDDHVRKCFYSSTSNIILEQIQLFLKKYNIACKINGIKLNFYGDNASKFLSLLYDGANFSLSRKRDRFMKWSNN